MYSLDIGASLFALLHRNPLVEKGLENRNIFSQVASYMPLAFLQSLQMYSYKEEGNFLLLPVCFPAYKSPSEKFLLKEKKRR